MSRGDGITTTRYSFDSDRAAEEAQKERDALAAMADADVRSHDVLENLVAISKALTRLDKKVTDHIADEQANVNRAIEALATAAFPGADASAHRRSHEQRIALDKSRTDFWQKLTFELTKWGLIGFLGWLVFELASKYGLRH